jgi:hypothetical protein
LQFARAIGKSTLQCFAAILSLKKNIWFNWLWKIDAGYRFIYLYMCIFRLFENLATYISRAWMTLSSTENNLVHDLDRSN